MAKRKTNEAGSSTRHRADVLRVLGVLKAATADQIQRLSSPHLTYRHTTKKTAAVRKEARTGSHRGALNDLRRHGLSVDGGRTRGGEEVRLLTKDGLAAAGLELDRGPEEMGDMPKSAGRSGASHAMAVNETVIAMIRPKPDLDLVSGEPAEAVAAAQACVDAPDGIGTITSYATEVALPATGTWKNPGVGGAWADIVPGGRAAAAVHRGRQLHRRRRENSGDSLHFIGVAVTAGPRPQAAGHRAHGKALRKRSVEGT